MSDTAVETGTIRTKIPSRLDRLPWSRFHRMVVVGLGTAWILDGLEVTIVGTVSSRMTEAGSGITISTAQIGVAGSVYVAGACLGALFFGQLTDRFGRKRLFMLTLGLYLIATAATAASFDAWFFFGARFLTGAGIGGEYAAINSAIDELIPARARGRVDLIINGSYWVGSAAGSAASIALLNTAWLPKDVGWRLGFVLGVILAIAVMLVRRNVPESPRWLFIHGREEEAEEIVRNLERAVEEETGERLEPVHRELTVRQRKTIPFREIARVAVKVYPRRSALALALFVGQAFIYNGITFNLGTLMTTFFKVSSGFVPVFIILYAAANFAGPLTIGRLFDTVGRKPMISGTYLGSAALGVVLAILFGGGMLNRWTFIGMVMATFFLASAGASAAYLTASEIFPMETRALAIAFFYAIGTAIGGISGPLLFGNLIGSGNVGHVAIAFYIGSGVMALGGITEIFWGIAAEGQQLEDVAKPLTVGDAETQQETGEPRDKQGRPFRAASEEVRQARSHAAEHRAHAAQHRAAMHVQLAAAREGDEAAARHAGEERVLAEIADLLAQADDQEAVAAEEDAGGGADREDRQAADQGDTGTEQAGREDTERAAAGTDGQAHASGRRASGYRAAAARSRAAALRTQASALTMDSGADAEHQRALAAAHRERALAMEQRAEAELAGEQDDGDRTQVAAAVHEMDQAWARLHEARAAASEMRAAGVPDEDAQRVADAALERACAAEERVSAAEHLQDARQEREEAAREEDEEAAREAEWHRRELEREKRIRARLRRRAATERGLRRLRLGPGRAVAGSPVISSMAPPPESLDHEISAIERVLNERGPLPRQEIQRLVGAGTGGQACSAGQWPLQSPKTW